MREGRKIERRRERRQIRGEREHEEKGDEATNATGNYRQERRVKKNDARARL